MHEQSRKEVEAVKMKKTEYEELLKKLKTLEEVLLLKFANNLLDDYKRTGRIKTCQILYELDKIKKSKKR